MIRNILWKHKGSDLLLFLVVKLPLDSLSGGFYLVFVKAMEGGLTLSCK